MATTRDSRGQKATPAPSLPFGPEALQPPAMPYEPPGSYCFRNVPTWPVNPWLQGLWKDGQAEDGVYGARSNSLKKFDVMRVLCVAYRGGYEGGNLWNSESEGGFP